MLQILLDGGGNVRLIPSQFAEPQKGIACEIHFLKTVKDHITFEGIRDQVLVSSMRNSPSMSLYLMLQRVFAPLIRQGGDLGARKAIKD